MRWKNGGPKKLYVVVDQEVGTIEAFDRKSDALAEKRSEAVFHPQVLLTYVQEDKCSKKSK